MAIDELDLWEQCVDFHGHSCGGLTIGWKAALYVLGLFPSPDAEFVCIAEKDFCGVDAIRVMLGCDGEKGNLFLVPRNEIAFNIYEKKSGRSLRLLLRDGPAGMSREAAFAYYQRVTPDALFDVQPALIPLPEDGAEL